MSTPTSSNDREREAAGTAHAETDAQRTRLEAAVSAMIVRRTTNLVVVTDADRRIEWVNEAFEQITGWSLDEVKGGKPGRYLQTKDTDPATVTYLREKLDAGESTQAEVLNRSRAGRDYWVLLDIQAVRGPDGALSGFVSIGTDITESRNQAEALRQSAREAAAARATLEAAVGALRDGFVVYDAEDRLVICNERYRELYPQSAPAIVPGASFESILRYGLERGEYVAARGREEEWLAERLELHRAVDNEIEQPLSDGRWLRVYEQATPEGGRVGLRVDITALKLAEKRALADLSAAMEASQDGIAITAADGSFLYMNRAHMAMFGYSDEREVIGQNWQILYSPEEAVWMREHAIARLLADGRWSGEVTGRKCDGTPVEQDVSLTLKDDGGILCITRDISLRRQEVAERARLRDELELAQRREMTGQIAAGLAHDFNNLLAIISGTASLIEARCEPEGAMAAGAGRILAATDQAAGLVKRLLTFGARSPERRRLDLRHPVAEAAELARAGLRAPLYLELDLPQAPIEAVADQTDILQVVLNLAMNARDAMELGGGRINIALAEATDDDLAGPFALGKPGPGLRHVCLSIADNGAGMTEQTAAQIFHPYFTTKGDKGTGLGLAVVSSIVVRNGGAVRLDTAPGEGTRFRVLWPVDAAEVQSEAEPDERLTGRLDGRVILVVDDQPDVLEVLTAFLEEAGAEVAPSTDPADVLEALHDDPDIWDLLITDYDMLQMNGAELAGQARAVVPGLPVVLVTALAGLVRRHGGADAVLGKPVDRMRLVSAAEAAILRARPKEA